MPATPAPARCAKAAPTAHLPASWRPWWAATSCAWAEPAAHLQQRRRSAAAAQSRTVQATAGLPLWSLRVQRTCSSARESLRAAMLARQPPLMATAATATICGMQAGQGSTHSTCWWELPLHTSCGATVTATATAATAAAATAAGVSRCVHGAARCCECAVPLKSWGGD